MLCQFRAVDAETAICDQCGRSARTHGHAVERIRRDCGPAVNARPCEGCIKPPGIIRKAVNLVGSAAAHIANGGRLVPDAVHAERVALCKACEYFRAGACLKCGCNIRLKAKSAALACPVGKWQRWSPERPRVVFLTPSLGMGGAERVILSQCRYFSTFGVDVAGVWLHENGPAWGPFLDELQELQIPVYSTEKRTEDSMRRSATLVESLTAAMQDADIAISWGLPDAADLLAAAGWTGPHVVVAHGPGPWAERQMAVVAPKATHFAAVSRPAVTAFPERYRSQVRVLWNGAETDRIAATVGKDQQRTRWGVLRHETLLGYIGRFSFNKHPEACARAVSELPTNYHALMIGDGIEATPIRQLAREIAGDRVTMPGPTDDVGSALAALDCWMLCSQAEGLSIAMCEAMLAGVPIVCTRVGAVDELEQQFGQLFVTVSNDATNAQLAEACLVAMSDGHRSIVDRAQQIAREHLTAELSAKRWADWLKEISRTKTEAA